MKVQGLDGKTHVWSLYGLEVGLLDDVKRSGLHLAVRAFLKSVLPTTTILEEVYLPGSGGLTADFYLPTRRTIVEAHGEQHRKYVPHFHASRMGWLLQQKRDGDKIRWAELNNIRLVELYFDEDVSIWQKTLIG